MKKSIVLILVSFLAAALHAQEKNWEEVLYLKDGSIIRGVIIEQIPSKTIKIQTKDRNVFVYKVEDIEKITKEELPVEKTDTEAGSKKKFDNAAVKESGFSNITEIGGIFGVGNVAQEVYYSPEPLKYANTQKFFALTTVNGYQIKRRGFIGFGLGTEVSKLRLLLPLFIDGRYYPLKRRVTPVLGAGAGYALSWLRNPPQGIDPFTKGGALAYAQAGVRIYISNNVSWTLMLGYRMQHGWIEMSITDQNGSEGGTYLSNYFGHFFLLKTGFIF